MTDTEHHKFLVCMVFNDNDPVRLIAKIEKTDFDELAIILDDKTYYFSLRQFESLFEGIKNE